MKFRRTVAVYILNNENQVLMLKHKKLNVWIPPGGSVEENEMTHVAAAREVKEETGLDIEFICGDDYTLGCVDERAIMLPRPIFVQLECNEGEDFVYLAKAKSNAIDNRENHEIDWFSFEDVLNLDAFENVKVHLRYIKDKFNY